VLAAREAADDLDRIAAMQPVVDREAER